MDFLYFLIGLLIFVCLFLGLYIYNLKKDRAFNFVALPIARCPRVLNGMETDRSHEDDLVPCEVCKCLMRGKDTHKVQITDIFTWRTHIEHYCGTHKPEYDTVKQGKYYKTIAEHKVEVKVKDSK
jgi:hypothetical protein